jgi:hypothetical protein
MTRWTVDVCGRKKRVLSKRKPGLKEEMEREEMLERRWNGVG